MLDLINNGDIITEIVSSIVGSLLTDKNIIFEKDNKTRELLVNAELDINNKTFNFSLNYKSYPTSIN